MKVNFNRAVVLGQSDNKFASINQVVVGTPPLYTGGVHGCTVIAGNNGSEDWLMHVDSKTITSNEPYHFMERMRPTTIVALAPNRYISFIEDNDPIGIIQVNNYVGLLKQVLWNGTDFEMLDWFPDVLTKLTSQDISMLRKLDEDMDIKLIAGML